MITLLVLAVLAVAAYRATQLVVHDTLLDLVRDRVHAWHAARPASALRTGVITLISCTYCAGWWLSGAILATYLFATGSWDTAPALVHGIEWFAVAGGQALLNRHDDNRPVTA
ncbi:DUF1360 domain-containing protein [Streptomyces sp. NPDC057963]|uniref:DUF1360 domain-containing protein n=1 Tax=Streptomyces sp. NPDC057963 TaxID=3346290 RepID=UPI0036EE363D